MTEGSFLTVERQEENSEGWKVFFAHFLAKVGWFFSPLIMGHYWPRLEGFFSALFWPRFEGFFCPFFGPFLCPGWLVVARDAEWETKLLWTRTNVVTGESNVQVHCHPHSPGDDLIYEVKT